MVVKQERLASTLRDFASTLLTDFPIQDILDHLVTRIVETLPVTAVGITLISPGAAPLYVAASDGSALRFEKLQTELSQGPCVLAYEVGDAVSIPDVAVESRFPQFTAAALPLGMVAAFAFPLRHGDGRLGALDLYRNTAGPLDPEDMDVAQTLADVAAAYLLNAQARVDARATSDRFENSALHDPLTGLPNRLLLHQRLNHAAQRARRSRTFAAVLFADIDRFKQINDTYGHQVGDDLLVAVAQRLTELLRPGDTLARISGDEFIFLCEDLRRVEDVELLAARIGEALSVPFQLPTVTITATASVGVAFSGPGQAITNQLVVDADGAMYQAKRGGGASHQIIDLREAQLRNERGSLEQELHKAFADRQLELHYQPVVRLSDGLVVGVEALLRWTHPQRGAIPTIDVIALAEANGLISSIGEWVLETACATRQLWLERHHTHPLELAVNLSARQLMSAHLPNTIAEILDRTGTDPTWLILELTENIFIRDAARAVSVLTDLKALGVRLALDDFGTGYSSLSYLRDFPVDIIKIDRKFVAASAVDPGGRAIVSAVTQLAHDLDLLVVAEGVETQQELDVMTSVGCELVQGYYYSQAIPEDRLAAVLGAAEGHLTQTPAARRRRTGLRAGG
jgi:diguanylate cyclase (GGDEF)-like protein